MGNRSRLSQAVRLIVIILSGLSFISCGSVPARPSKPMSAYEPDLPYCISLAGKWKMRVGDLEPAKFYLPSVQDRSWEEVFVPANWYLQGIDHSGVIWFRRHFTADARWAGKMVKLVFEGVDYAADVWLNGSYIGFHEGYFSPFSFFVSNVIRPGADNILVVRVNSPYEEPGRTWSLKKRLIKGIFNHHDTRPGGAWSLRGQEKNTGGIWGPVYLRVSKQVSMNSVKIKPIVELDKDTARVEIAASITCAESSDTGGGSAEFTFDLRISPHNILPYESKEIQLTASRLLVKGENLLNFNIPSFKALLWWPWELGKPNLYRLEMTIRRDGIILDRVEKIFGFRSVECDPSTMVWRINGKRLFLRGTNYIASQWLSEMTREKYAYDLALMKRAYINTIRVHAHVTSRDFYKLCDEMGLMVWQDFPLQWGYTDDQAFIEKAIHQAGEMVNAFFNHPSIIAWCGHNEPPWDAQWMKYKYKGYNPEQNKALDEKLYIFLKSLDNTRYVQKHSATSEHPWYGWYSGSWLDYGKPTKRPFITEFGAQALPHLETLRKIFKEEELWPDSEKDWKKWEYHNFQKKENFEIAKVKMGSNIREFIANTQQYQSRLIKYASESYRRQRFRPVTGIFQFMFVEGWPSINWGIVDYWRNPKPGYKALKTAFQPILPSIEYEKDVWAKGDTVQLKLWIINDLLREIKGASLKYYLRDEKEEMLARESITVDILPDSAKLVSTISRSNLPEGVFNLQVVLEDRQGDVLAQNNFQFRIEGSAKQ